MKAHKTQHIRGRIGIGGLQVVIIGRETRCRGSEARCIRRDFLGDGSRGRERLLWREVIIVLREKQLRDDFNANWSGEAYENGSGWQPQMSILRTRSQLSRSASTTRSKRKNQYHIVVKFDQVLVRVALAPCGSAINEFVPI